MGAVKNVFWDEITAEPCANCGQPVKEDDLNTEAFEQSLEIMCQPCAEGYLETIEADQ